MVISIGHMKQKLLCKVYWVKKLLQQRVHEDGKPTRIFPPSSCFFWTILSGSMVTFYLDDIDIVKEKVQASIKMPHLAKVRIG